jgi:hypothetical protein
MAMTADDGPHDANDIALMGDGDCRLTYRFEPPSKPGFSRHVDNESGVADWWEPFTESWTRKTDSMRIDFPLVLADFNRYKREHMRRRRLFGHRDDGHHR